NSPNSCASMLHTVQNRAAATSESKAKPPMARQNATTRTSLTAPPGNGRVQARGLLSTKNRSPSSTFRFRKGVTSSHESHAQDLAAAKRKRTGQFPQLSGKRRYPRYVVPRNARRTQRRPDQSARASCCVRARLPRGYLWLVRFPDQRRGPWRPARDNRVPACDALLQRRRRDNARAVACPSLPGDSRSGCEPVGL